MKPIKTIPFLLLLALLMPGCATSNVNPAQARANTGYVDFHADPSGDLCWEVASCDDRTGDFQTLFSELDPPPRGILRLAFAPGSHRLRVTFMNRVIVQPVEIDVAVQDGKIIPIRVTLTAAGTAQVKTREVTRGATARGRYGRRTEFGSNETVRYGLSAVAETPVPYEPKEQMPYAH